MQSPNQLAQLAQFTDLAEGALRATVHCPLHNDYCLLPNAYPSPQFPTNPFLSIPVFSLPVYCLLPTAYCLLLTAYCLLLTSYYLLLTTTYQPLLLTTANYYYLPLINYWFCVRKGTEAFRTHQGRKGRKGPRDLLRAN